MSVLTRQAFSGDNPKVSICNEFMRIAYKECNPRLRLHFPLRPRLYLRVIQFTQPRPHGSSPFLGRKKPNADPELRGKADYICEVGRRIRWTIEAKSPGGGITSDDIEQAFTYANHPEVRGVYFCLCNGFEFRIYRTVEGTKSPVLSISYGEMNQKYDVLENVLSPSAIIRDYPTYVVDVGKPIGRGLRSVVRIAGGYIEYSENSYNSPVLKGLISTITGGAIERDENGWLTAVVHTRSPFASMQRLNERLGLSNLDFVSKDSALSVAPGAPTKFWLAQRVFFSKGERMFNLATWSEIELPINIICNSETTAEGILVGQDFKGSFDQIIRLDFSGMPAQLIAHAQPALDRLRILRITGRFEVRLA